MSSKNNVTHDQNESPNVCENECNTEEFNEEYTEDPCEQLITIDDINIVTEMNTSQLAIQGRRTGYNKSGTNTWL